ncbi:unnamed protein product [Cochlearia groenlandica]
MVWVHALSPLEFEIELILIHFTWREGIKDDFPAFELEGVLVGLAVMEYSTFLRLVLYTQGSPCNQHLPNVSYFLFLFFGVRIGLLGHYFSIDAIMDKELSKDKLGGDEPLAKTHDATQEGRITRSKAEKLAKGVHTMLTEEGLEEEQLITSTKCSLMQPKKIKRLSVLNRFERFESEAATRVILSQKLLRTTSYPPIDSLRSPLPSRLTSTSTTLHQVLFLCYYTAATLTIIHLIIYPSSKLPSLV